MVASSRTRATSDSRVNLARPDNGPIEQLEGWVVRLERKHDELRDAFHAHAEQPVHAGFVEVLQEIREDLKILQTRWLQVGGAVIFLLLGILGALLMTLYTLLSARAGIAAPQPATIRPTCSMFASQAAAQEFYRANRALALVLDANRNGVACQSSPPPYDLRAVTDP